MNVTLETIVVAWITVFALALFIISAISYHRIGNKRVLMLSLAFMMFFLKGLLASIEMLTSKAMFESYIFIDLIILMLLAFAILLRRGSEDD